MENKNKINMSEKEARYRAVEQVAALLRETTKTIMKEDNSGFHFEHGNIIFSKEEHATVKKAFLKMVSEI